MPKVSHFKIKSNRFFNTQNKTGLCWYAQPNFLFLKSRIKTGTLLVMEITILNIFYFLLKASLKSQYEVSFMILSLFWGHSKSGGFCG